MKMLFLSCFCLFVFVKTAVCGTMFEIDTYVTGTDEPESSNQSGAPRSAEPRTVKYLNGAKIPYEELVGPMTFFVPEESGIHARIIDDKFYFVLLYVKLPRLSSTFQDFYPIIAVCNETGKLLKNPNSAKDKYSETYNLRGSSSKIFTKEEILGSNITNLTLQVEVIEQKREFDDVKIIEKLPQDKPFNYYNLKGALTQLGLQTRNTFADNIELILTKPGET